MNPFSAEVEMVLPILTSLGGEGGAARDAPTESPKINDVRPKAAILEYWSDEGGQVTDKWISDGG